MRILIANRGEIARRIIRTAHALGHETVAAFADPDRDAPFVGEATRALRLGPADLASSYLSIDALIGAVIASGADAVHPGYGFLAERSAFARAVQAAGATWIGPNPDAIDRMGSKIEARRLAAAAGVAIIPGFDTSQDRAELIAAASRIGYPVLVKASAGGGGKGIRIAHDPSEIERALDEAGTEAKRSFGDDALIVERYVQRPRHVEVQVIGDQHGAVIHLGTRECSLQRRYQKIVEEAPAPNLSDATRAGLCRDGVALARAIGYDSAGTVEFVVDDETGDYFFLEMNTRLQVEHPVTELVTGLDLVALQIGSAQGFALPVGQVDISLRGHAMEARINAEDPWSNFMPQTGTVRAVRVPSGVRWDAAVEDGSVISPFYDPMIAKLVVHGPDRENARRKIVAALDRLLVAGPTTNTGFLRWLLEQPAVVAGRVTTRFLDETSLPAPPDAMSAATVAARSWRVARDARRRDNDTWQRIGPFRLTPHRPDQTLSLALGETTYDVAIDDNDPDDGPIDLVDGATDLVDLNERWVAVNVAGTTFTFDVPSRQTRWVATTEASAAAAGGVVSPFPAMVVEVHVAPGDEVHEGQVLVVIEAMKMLHSLVAKGAGVVDEVRVTPGTQVESHSVLVTFVTASPPSQE